jgi:predicted Zn-dependent peptidase
LYSKTTLDNGIRVITAGMPQARSVSVSIFLATGSRYENEKEIGISHFLEHMLFKGTQKRPTSRELSEAVEGVGGILNGETDKEITVYWCKVARPHFSIALDVLTDMVLHSNFDPVEIEKERQVIIEEINRTKDTPAQVVDDLTDEILWPGHPLGREILGTRETVSAMKKESMLDYIACQYSPQNAVFAIAGDIQHEEMVAAIAKATSGWKAGNNPRSYVPFTGMPNPRLRMEKRDTEQVHLCLALPGISYFDPRRYALDLLNVVLGGGMSSRLFLEIRDKLGLAYAIHSYIDHYLDSGAVVIYAGVEPKNLKTAINAILEQLARFKNELVPAEELVKAKEFSKGRILMRMEDSHAVAGWIGGQETLTGKVLTDEDVVAIVDSITAEDIRNIAVDLCDAKQLRLAVVGPVKGEGANLEDLLKF